MKRTLTLALAVLCSFGFVLAQQPSGDTPVKPERKMALAKPIVIDAEKEVYGAQLAGKECVPLAAVVKEPKAFDGKNVQLRGKITGVCTKKGCWMKLKDGDNEVRVSFTGYKFFVPLDVEGRDVAVEGKVQLKTETEAERRHYAQDAGKSPEEIAKIVGDATTVSFVADAVQIGKLPPAAKACCEEGQKKEGCCPEGEKKAEGSCPATGGTAEKKSDCGGCPAGGDGKTEKKSDCCEKKGGS